MPDIAAKLQVSRSSVSLWTRHVPVDQGPRRSGTRSRGPNAVQGRKQAEIDGLLEEGRRRIGELSERELLVAGIALYAGEGTKRDGCVSFANSDPAIIRLCCVWLRRFFDIEEERLRVRIYLHEGLDLDVATTFWSGVTGVPPSQFVRPYRAVADPTMRSSKHEHGCASVRYACSTTHRRVMGLVQALLASGAIPG